MPVVPYINRLEPAENAVTWRYVDLRKFRDLMASNIDDAFPVSDPARGTRRHGGRTPSSRMFSVLDILCQRRVQSQSWLHERPGKAS
jgi:hypothetical protein